MRILSTSKGFVLIFKSEKDLSGVITHLTGMLNWIRAESVLPPHLYAVFDDRISSIEIEKLLDEVKNDE